jgi:hypothetical protein
VHSFLPFFFNFSQDIQKKSFTASGSSRSAELCKAEHPPLRIAISFHKISKVFVDFFTYVFSVLIRRCARHFRSFSHQLLRTYDCSSPFFPSALRARSNHLFKNRSSTSGCGIASRHTHHHQSLFWPRPLRNDQRRSLHNHTRPILRIISKSIASFSNLVLCQLTCRCLWRHGFFFKVGSGCTLTFLDGG